MEWRAEYGSFSRRIFSVLFVDALSNTARVLRRSDFSRDAATRLRALPKLFKGWLYPSPKHRADFTKHALDLPESMLAPALSAAISRVKRWDADRKSDEEVAEAFVQLITDTRLSDQDKLDLLVLPWMLRHHALFMAAVDRTLHRPLRQAAKVDERWMDLDHEVDQETRSLSEWLLDPAELVALKDAREKAREEARQRAEEEEERRRQERERERREREERERVRAERTEALRRALAAGRGRADPAGLVVTEEFQKVFDLVESGEKLLFVTGKPGTGKSTLIHALKERLSRRNLAVLAFTGTAAMNVRGQTINSFFGMPFRILETGWVKESRSFKERAKALEVLVVDEVSMLRPDMLDAMDTSLKHARHDERPFGGVQLILVGDLYQLPPVIENQPAVREHYARVYQGRRFFPICLAFCDGKPLLVELTQVFRQKERDFLDFLARIRQATITGAELDAFNARIAHRPSFGSDEFHVVVTPRRTTADHINRVRLDQIEGPARLYECRIEGDVPPAGGQGDGSANRYPADVKLELKKDAQVIFLKNDGGGHWVNGDLGIVEELSDDWIRVTTWSGTWKVDRVTWPLTRYDLDPQTHRLVAFEYATFTQFPLRLAWASTIHKMQGQTVDRIHIDLTGGAFEPGMTYVALSRCRTTDGIRLTRPLVMADVCIDSSIPRDLAEMPRA